MRGSVFSIAICLISHIVSGKDYCDRNLRRKYCTEPYGGDLHTACKYCGIGPQCPSGVSPSGRGIKDPELQKEILERHNVYRNQVKQGKRSSEYPSSGCLQMLRWDDDLAEVAQIWADQCANVIYGHNDMYPKIFHERGMERTTKSFDGPPGVGQNVAWALTKDVNFSRIIDDLWYKDIGNFQPGYINEFNDEDSGGSLMTQIIWGRTTHVGCGWIQFPMGAHVGDLYPAGEYENFLVCNYGVGGNVPGEPVYNCIQDSQPTPLGLDIQFGERFVTSSPEIQSEILACFEATTCNKASPSVQEKCQETIADCMGEMENELTIFVTPEDRARVFECRVEFILCSVEIDPGYEACNEFYEFCKVNRLTSTSTDVVLTSKDVDLTTLRPPPLSPSVTLPLTSAKPNLSSSKIDISFYNATVRTSYRLAICLEGARCSSTKSHNDTCFALQMECNQGLNVSKVNNAIRKKLSECAIDDILCHLDGSINTYFCQRKYEICADIVIPNDVTISALPLLDSLSPDSNKEGNSHLEPFLFLLGLTDAANDVLGEDVPPTENVLTNVTNKVLGAIDKTFGGIEILPSNVSLETLLKDNETLSIFQDIVVVIKTNETDNTTQYSVSGQGPIDVIDKYPDLSNATVVFSTSNIKVGGSGISSIHDPIVDGLKEKIRESLSEIATECNSHICFQALDDPNEQLHNPFPDLEEVMSFKTPGELQLKIAVCLQGIRCVREKTCLKAQKKCIGQENVENYQPKERIQISECVLEAHVCRIENGGTDERCDITFNHCLNPILDLINRVDIKDFDLEFLSPEYANLTNISQILNFFPENITPTKGDEVLIFSDQVEKTPEELIKDITSNITEMIMKSGDKMPIQLIPINLPRWHTDVTVADEDSDGVITLLNSNPHFPFRTPNGTTTLLLDPKEDTFNMIEQTITGIVQNPMSKDSMKNIVENITKIFQKSDAQMIELRPVNKFPKPSSENDLLMGNVVLLKKPDGQIAIISSSPFMAFNPDSERRPIATLDTTNMIPEEIRAIVEKSISDNRIQENEGSNTDGSKHPINRHELIDGAVDQLMSLIGEKNEGTIRLRPINRIQNTNSFPSQQTVTVVQEKNSEDRVFQIISQTPEIMTFITPQNSTISFDLESVPHEDIAQQIHKMLNFIARGEIPNDEPKEKVKSSPLKEIAQRISSEMAPGEHVVQIRPINAADKTPQSVVMIKKDNEEVIEVISHDENTVFSTPDSVIVTIDVKDLHSIEKMSNRIEDTLISLTLNPKKTRPSNANNNVDQNNILDEYESVIRQLATEITILSRNADKQILIRPDQFDPESSFRNVEVEKDSDSEIISLKVRNPNMKFITPSDSTLTIEISDIGDDDMLKRVEDTLRSILILETLAKGNDLTKNLIQTGITNEILQNLSSTALNELNGTVGGGLEILPIQDPQELFDLLSDNDTLQFKVDFMVEPEMDNLDKLSQNGKNGEPLIVISNTPIRPINGAESFNENDFQSSPVINIDSLGHLGTEAVNAVKNQLFHSFGGNEESETGLSEKEKELNNVVEDIIREMNLINKSKDEVVLRPEIGNDGVQEANEIIKIPGAFKDDNNFKLPEAPIKIKLKNDDAKTKIKNILNQISSVMNSMENQNEEPLDVLDVAHMIANQLPTELADAGVILIPKKIKSVESLDSGHKEIFVFAVPLKYPNGSLENGKEIYINLSPEKQKLNGKTKTTLVDLLKDKIIAETKVHKENKNNGNFVLDLPIFGITVSELSEKNNKNEILPLPGKTNVLSIPQFGFNISVNNETDFLKLLHDDAVQVKQDKLKEDPIENGSELTVDSHVLLNEDNESEDKHRFQNPINNNEKIISSSIKPEIISFDSDQDNNTESTSFSNDATSDSLFLFDIDSFNNEEFVETENGDGVIQNDGSTEDTALTLNPNKDGQDIVTDQNEALGDSEPNSFTQSVFNKVNLFDETNNSSSPNLTIQAGVSNVESGNEPPVKVSEKIPLFDINFSKNLTTALPVTSSENLLIESNDSNRNQPIKNKLNQKMSLEDNASPRINLNSTDDIEVEDFDVNEYNTSKIFLNLDTTTYPIQEPNINFDTTTNSLQETNINFDSTTHPLQEININFDPATNPLQEPNINFDTTTKRIKKSDINLEIEEESLTSTISPVFTTLTTTESQQTTTNYQYDEVSIYTSSPDVQATTKNNAAPLKITSDSSNDRRQEPNELDEEIRATNNGLPVGISDINGYTSADIVTEVPPKTNAPLKKDESKEEGLEKFAQEFSTPSPDIESVNVSNIISYSNDSESNDFSNNHEVVGNLPIDTEDSLDNEQPNIFVSFDDDEPKTALNEEEEPLENAKPIPISSERNNNTTLSPFLTALPINKVQTSPPSRIQGILEESEINSSTTSGLQSSSRETTSSKPQNSLEETTSNRRQNTPEETSSKVQNPSDIVYDSDFIFEKDNTLETILQKILDDHSNHTEDKSTQNLDKENFPTTISSEFFIPSSDFPTILEHAEPSEHSHLSPFIKDTAIPKENIEKINNYSDVSEKSADDSTPPNKKFDLNAELANNISVDNAQFWEKTTRANQLDNYDEFTTKVPFFNLPIDSGNQDSVDVFTNSANDWQYYSDENSETRDSSPFKSGPSLDSTLNEFEKAAVVSTSDRPGTGNTVGSLPIFPLQNKPSPLLNVNFTNPFQVTEGNQKESDNEKPLSNNVYEEKNATILEAEEDKPDLNLSKNSNEEFNQIQNISQLLIDEDSKSSPQIPLQSEDLNGEFDLPLVSNIPLSHKNSLLQHNSESSTQRNEATTTSKSVTPTGISTGVKGVILGILAALVTQNFGLSGVEKFPRDPTPVFRDPEIRKKIEENNIVFDENNIVFDENNINFTIPVNAHEHFEVENLQEDLQNAIKSVFKPSIGVPKLTIAVEDQTKDGMLTINAKSTASSATEDRNKLGTSLSWKPINPSFTNKPSSSGIQNSGLNLQSNTENVRTEDIAPPELLPPTVQSSVDQPINEPFEDGLLIGFDENSWINTDEESSSSSVIDSWEPDILLLNTEKTEDSSNIKDANDQGLKFNTNKKESEIGLSSQEYSFDNSQPGIILNERQPSLPGGSVNIFKRLENEYSDHKLNDSKSVSDSDSSSWQWSEIEPQSDLNGDQNVVINQSNPNGEQNGWKTYDSNAESVLGTNSSDSLSNLSGIIINQNTQEEDVTYPSSQQSSSDKQSTLAQISLTAGNNAEELKRKNITANSGINIKKTIRKPETWNASSSFDQWKSSVGQDQEVKYILAPDSNPYLNTSLNLNRTTVTASSVTNKDDWIDVSLKNNSEDIKKVASPDPSLNLVFGSNPSKVAFKPKIPSESNNTNEDISLNQTNSINLESRINDKILSTYYQNENDDGENLVDSLETDKINPGSDENSFYNDLKINDEKRINYVSEEENKFYDRRLNFLNGESSADIIEATVVEDLNYARSIRNSRGMGIGTIASITIGILVLFGFALLAFMAVARRRRRYLDDGNLYGITTPTQSRTSYTDTPLGTVYTPSMSELRPSYTEEAPTFSSTGNGNQDSVLQIDGHQTIISSYNEFIAAGENGDSPSPPPLRTKNLSDSSEYLFARQQI